MLYNNKKHNYFRSKHFELHQIADTIFAAIAADGGSAICNSGIIDLGGQIVIFDTFLTPQAALDLLNITEEMFGRRPQIVVNSHYHNDHIWGNQVFMPGSQIISSDETRELINTTGMEELSWYSANSAQQLKTLQIQYQDTTDEQQRKQLSMWIGYYRGLLEAFPNLSVTLPGILFKDRYKIQGSKKTAELIAFEGGHTQSDTILHLPKEGILFMGDLMFVDCHPYIGDGDPLQLLKTLEELSQFGATCLVPGHGPVGSIADLNLLIEYINYCIDTAHVLVKEGSCNEEWMRDVRVADKYKHWRFPQFFQSNIRFLCQKFNMTTRDQLDL